MLIHDFIREMDDLRKNFHNQVNAYEQEYYRNGDYPYTNVVDNEDHFEVQALLPGVNAEDVNITFENGTLTISGERKSDLDENVKIIRQERRFGKFHKNLKVNAPVNVGSIKASYKEGILYINLPKAEEAKPVKIAIE